MRSQISEYTYTGDAGRIIARSQGITDEREICLFMDALTEEYNRSDSCTEAKGFLNSMMDFVRNPEDDFIIGRTRKFPDGSTAIYSNEHLPKELYDAKVEVRLKKIEPPAPMKAEFASATKVENYAVWTGFGPTPNVYLRYKDGFYSLIFAGLEPFIGKRVKVTIEELKE